MLHINVNISTAIHGMQWLCHNLKICPKSWNFNKFQLLSGLRDGFQAQNSGDKLARKICWYHLCRFYSFGPDLYLEGMRSFSPFVFCFGQVTIDIVDFWLDYSTIYKCNIADFFVFIGEVWILFPGRFPTTCCYCDFPPR